MHRPPRDPKEPILGRQRWIQILLYGALFTASVLGALAIAEQILGLDPGGAVTISFLTLAFAQLWHIFNMRRADSGVILNEITRNPYVWGALALCTGLTVFAVYTPGLSDALGIEPPTAAGWLLVIGMSLIPLLVGQTIKIAKTLGKKRLAATI